jgi:hypothetical protein
MIGEGYRLEKIAKKPPHLGLGFQKTTTFQENFKKTPFYPLNVAKTLIVQLTYVKLLLIAMAHLYADMAND